MFRYIMRRIALAPLILFGSTFLVYNLAAYANDPLQELRLSTDDGARQQIIALTRDLNLDVPAPLDILYGLKAYLAYLLESSILESPVRRQLSGMSFRTQFPSAFA